MRKSLFLLFLLPILAFAGDEQGISVEMFTVNNTWMLVATLMILVIA